ncbi:hypothetical protein SAMN06272789_2966 [Streptomyces sp. 1331.2]|nr:hypothetical protein SAMN06272789_2966 [Streptomyces sp. 1331.2]
MCGGRASGTPPVWSGNGPDGAHTRARVRPAGRRERGSVREGPARRPAPHHAVPQHGTRRERALPAPAPNRRAGPATPNRPRSSAATSANADRSGAAQCSRAADAATRSSRHNAASPRRSHQPATSAAARCPASIDGVMPNTPPCHQGAAAYACGSRPAEETSCSADGLPGRPTSVPGWASLQISRPATCGRVSGPEPPCMPAMPVMPVMEPPRPWPLKPWKRQCSASCPAPSAPAMPASERSRPPQAAARPSTATKPTASAVGGTSPPPARACPAAAIRVQTSANGTARASRRSQAAAPTGWAGPGAPGSGAAARAIMAGPSSHCVRRGHGQGGKSLRMPLSAAACGSGCALPGTDPVPQSIRRTGGTGPRARFTTESPGDT